MSTITSTGYKLPTSIISNGSTTGNEWSDPNNALLVDDVFASSDPNNAASDFILGNYNFNLPQDAVVTGIEMKVIGYRGAQTSPVITLTPYAVDNTSGTDVFYPYVTPFTGLTQSNAEHVLGSSTYLFATSFTPDQLNNLKFQMVANGNIYLDSVLVNVYYYIEDPITPPVVVGDSCTDCNSTIQAQTFYLARAFKAGDTKAYLKSFNYPNGAPIQYAHLGSCGGYLNFVFDQGKAKTDQSQNFEENARCAVWTVLPSGIVELDFVALTNRGRQFYTPNAHDADLLSDHDANSEVIISNNSDYENRRLQRCHIGSIVSAPIVVQNESVDIVNPTSTIDFQGGGVSVAVDGTDPEKAIVTIAGVGGTTPPNLDDESDATSGSTQVPSLTWNHTCSGVNRLLTVEVSMEAGKTVTGITYNGVAMTLVPSATASTGTVRTEIWKLVAPAVGTNAIVVTFSANSYCSAGAQSWVGVDQTTSTGTVQTATGTSLAPSLVLATTYDNSIIVDGLSTAQTPILYTKGAGQSENWHRTANTDTRQGGGSYELSGSAPDNVTMSWSITQNTPWALVAVEIKGITSPTPVSTPIEVEDEGVSVSANVTKINFKGAGVTASLAAPGEVDVDIPGGGSGSGSAIQETVTQTAHGFSADEVLRSSGVDGEYTTAQADTPANADVVGFVVSVTNANEFVIGTGGFFNLTALPGGAVAGDNLYLDETTPGATTLTPPTTPGTVSQPLARVIDASTNLVFWNNWRGMENQATPIVGGSGEFTNGVTSKNTADASGVQNIPHGLSSTPNKITITFMAPAVGSSGTNLYQAVLSYDGTTSSVIGRAFINGANRDMSGTDIILYGPASGNQTEFQTGVVTFDATNIIITWTKTNSPTGVVGMMWEAEIGGGSSGAYTVNADETQFEYWTNQLALYYDVGATAYPNGWTVVNNMATTANLTALGVRYTGFNSGGIYTPAGFGDTGGSSLEFDGLKKYRIKFVAQIISQGASDETGFGLCVSGGLTDLPDQTAIDEAIKIVWAGATNSIYFATGDGVTNENQNTTAYTFTDPHLYEIIWDPVAGESHLYIDGTLVFTNSTIIPTGANAVAIGLYHNSTTADVIISKPIVSIEL